MPHSLPKYVKRVRSKGRDYLYFDTGKKVDGKRIYSRLPPLRDPKFGGSYAALMGHRNRGTSPDNILTVPRLIDLYQRSERYKRLRPASMKLYDTYLYRFQALMPTAPADEITIGDMRKLVDGLAATPGAANAFLKATGAMFAWARAYEHVPANPCKGIEKMQGGEHDAWPLPVLRAALASNDPRVRLVTHLLYYTAQRLGDVLKMEWADIADGRVLVHQEKTGKPLRIKLHKGLQAELDKTPRIGLTIVTNTAGNPLSGDMARKALTGFTEAFGDAYVPHGLRKNAVIKLLEVGCSIAQTAAVSGQTLAMVEHYAKQRNQERLADEAMNQWEGSDDEHTNL